MLISILVDVYVEPPLFEKRARLRGLNRNAMTVTVTTSAHKSLFSLSI